MFPMPLPLLAALAAMANATEALLRDRGRASCAGGLLEYKAADLPHLDAWLGSALWRFVPEVNHFGLGGEDRHLYADESNFRVRPYTAIWHNQLQGMSKNDFTISEKRDHAIPI